VREMAHCFDSARNGKAPGNNGRMEANSIKIVSRQFPKRATKGEIYTAVVDEWSNMCCLLQTMDVLH